jgi:hypothetical protein
MGEIFGVLVIAVSSLVLFALSSVQVAHRIAGARTGALSQAVVLPELDELPVRLVVGMAAAMAVSSQLPVAYLLGLPGGDLSAVSFAVLLIEIGAAFTWTADLAGARRIGLGLVRRPATVTLARIGARRRRAA